VADTRQRHTEFAGWALIRQGVWLQHAVHAAVVIEPPRRHPRFRPAFLPEEQKIRGIERQRECLLTLHQVEGDSGPTLHPVGADRRTRPDPVAGQVPQSRGGQQRPQAQRCGVPTDQRPESRRVPPPSGHAVVAFGKTSCAQFHVQAVPVRRRHP